MYMRRVRVRRAHTDDAMDTAAASSSSGAPSGHPGARQGQTESAGLSGRVRTRQEGYGTADGMEDSVQNYVDVDPPSELPYPLPTQQRGRDRPRPRESDDDEMSRSVRHRSDVQYRHRFWSWCCLGADDTRNAQPRQSHFSAREVYYGPTRTASSNPTTSSTTTAETTSGHNITAGCLTLFEIFSNILDALTKSKPKQKESTVGDAEDYDGSQGLSGIVIGHTDGHLWFVEVWMQIHLPQEHQAQQVWPPHIPVCHHWWTMYNRNNRYIPVRALVCQSSSMTYSDWDSYHTSTTSML